MKYKSLIFFEGALALPSKILALMLAGLDYEIVDLYLTQVATYA